MPATLPAPGIEVEIALGVGSTTALARWDTGTFDFSSWGSADTSLGDWTDVTCDTLTPFTMGAGSGADGVVTRWEAATCAFELVGDIYDPRSGAYAGLVGPGLPVRVRWRPTGTDEWYTAFQGATDDEGFTYNPKTARAKVAATDGTRIFSAFDGVEQPEQGRNETAAQRVARIADLVGWPAPLRDIEAGGVTCQATTLSQTAWTMLLQVADTDLALLWINRAGQLAYRPQAKVTPAHELAAIVGCDVPDVPDGVHVIDPVDMVGQQSTTIRNIVSISRQAPDDTGEAATFTARDDTSVARFLAHAYQRTDLIHTDDAWSQTVAQSVLMTSAWPASAPASIDLSSRADPAAPALLLALEPSLSIEVYDGARAWQMEPAGWAVTVDRGEVSGTIDLVDVSMWYGSAWDDAEWELGQWGF